MKKYLAVWGALFFFVICISLYLMMETVNTSPGRFPDIDRNSLSNFEQKISEIQSDIEKNHKTIEEIKDAVRKLSNGDAKSVNRLKEILENKNEDLKLQREKILKMGKDSTNKKDPGGLVVDMKQAEYGEKKGIHPAEVAIKQVEDGGVKKEQPAAIEVKYEPKSWGGSFVVLRKEVSVSDDTCTWVDAPKAQTDVQMMHLFDILPFDNPDGGVWKQGWDVTYPQGMYGAQNKLKVFVVPHTHNDPGWVKTFDDYYVQQTKNIFELMVNKLEQYPNGKFMYAEMSFFSRWWNEVDDAKKERVKKLLANGQLEMVTGGWVMTDEANAHYYAMLDQLIEGHQWLNGTLGVKPKSGWAIDPFGHTPTMAYLLRRSGFTSMLIQRVHYSIKKHLAKNKQLEFMWRQQWDKAGTSDMFCHMMPFYSYDVPHTCGPDPKICCQFDFRRLPGSSYNCPWHAPPVPINDANVVQRSGMLLDQWRKKAQLYKSNTLFIPLGDDFRYDKSDEWDLQFTNYFKMFNYMNSHPELGVEAKFGTLSDYFTALYDEYKTKPGTKPGDFPVLSGDFFTYSDRDDHYWSGYYTSRPFYKNMDRLMEYHLRAAEILFSLASTLSRREGSTNFPTAKFMDLLIQARRNLGLYQHHDGITGTAKDFVVIDYGNRLLSALGDMKTLIKEAATYLSLDRKTEYLYSEDTPMFDVDETRASHDSLPERTVIKIGDVNDLPRPVMFYNSLGQARDEIVSLYVDSPSVEVKDSDGVTVLSQVDPVWTGSSELSSTKFKVSFRVSIPGLGIVRYTVRRVPPETATMNVPSVTEMFNTEASFSFPPFSIHSVQSQDIVLENPYLKASFSGTNGLLKLVTRKEDGVTHKTRLEFVQYGTVPKKDKSGAYLFLPDGHAKQISGPPPVIHVTRGPIIQEITVYMTLVQHTVRLYNSSGLDGISLDMSNIVDIRNQNNYEMAVRISTDVDNKGREFYTDLNGFQMQKHRTYDKLPLQANVYPMPTQAFIEDSKNRFSILSAQSLGFSNLNPGVMEVMLDRRLNQDDNRGLGQGVLDNKVTPSRFKLLLEKRQKGNLNAEKSIAFPSLLAHHTSLQLINPVFIIPKHVSSKTVPKQTSYSPLHSELSCDIHFLNLRTMQNKDDGATRLVPREMAGLYLHRVGVDCSFSNRGISCNSANGEVMLASLFKEVEISRAKSMSLTLMYEQEDIETAATLNLEPMEINAYQVSLK